MVKTVTVHNTIRTLLLAVDLIDLSEVIPGMNATAIADPAASAHMATGVDELVVSRPKATIA